MVTQIAIMVGLQGKSLDQREALAQYEPEGPCAKRRLNLAEGLILFSLHVSLKKQETKKGEKWRQENIGLM